MAENRTAKMKLAEVLGPVPDSLWRLAGQCGVRHAVGTFGRQGAGTDGDTGDGADGDGKPWSYMSLVRMKSALEGAGFTLSVIESRPPLMKAKLGLPGRDEEIAETCRFIEALGALEIPVWCYEWMAGFNWMRTSVAIPTRGGALTTGYDHALMRDAPFTQYGSVSEDLLWETLGYFLERVLPVAEKAGVRLAMHPDDPPVSPIRGVGRIMRSIDNFQRLLDMYPSPSNGIAMCQGNFALMTDNLPSVIRRFGDQGKIFFVHFRDVRGRPERFVETFHDDGQTDMLECVRAYRDIGFDGVCRPDHVPTVEGDDNGKPGYSAIGRLFALGYARGLLEAVYGR